MRNPVYNNTNRNPEEKEFKSKSKKTWIFTTREHSREESFFIEFRIYINIVFEIIWMYSQEMRLKQIQDEVNYTGLVARTFAPGYEL